jgi:hypothetical protein
MLIGRGQYGRVYKVGKGGRDFALKELNFESEDEQKLANEEERCFKLLKKGCPYLVEFIESFERVFFSCF